MKHFKKFALSLVLFLCLFIFAACGETKTQLDYQVKVNTNTNGYTETISEKSDAEKYTSSTGENYIAKESFGYKLTMKMKFDFGEGTYMNFDATGIYLFENENPQIGIKLTMTMKADDFSFKTISTMYLKDNIYYVAASALGTTEKYYMDPSDPKFEEYIKSFEGMQDYDFAEEIGNINDLINKENSIIKQYVKEEKNKTTTKIKIEVPSEEEGGHTNVAYIVLENDVFKGLHYSMDILDQVVNVDLVPYTGKIDFPSFNGYKNIADLDYYE